MTYEELKAKGTFVNEEDRYNGGIYLGTSYYYVLNDTLYKREEHTNLNSYTGETSTFILIDNVAAALEKYNSTYFKQMMKEETYEKLCEVCKKIDGNKEKIKSLRKATGLTQKEFAEYFEMSQRTLENWESGKAEPADYIIKLMKYKLQNENIITEEVKNNQE